MRVNKFAATAVLAIGATAISAGAVQAQPEPSPGVETGVRGIDHGIGYVAAPTPGRTGITTTVATGRFTVNPAGSVSLVDAAGNLVVTVPLQAAGLVSQIENDGRTLTLTPQSATSRTAQAIDEAADTLARKQYNAGIGALIGAGIGAVIGFFLGGVGALVTVPIGAGLGALIGFSTP